MAKTVSKSPVSYKDPYWTNLAAATETKLGLPPGLLQATITHGERTNADLVSSAGAKTVFQVIPSTRNAILNKYGVDAYADDASASEAAGLLYKESLDRNKGSISAAIAEYHGGTNKANHGPINRSYVARVVNAPILKGIVPVDAASPTAPVKARAATTAAPAPANSLQARIDARTAEINAQLNQGNAPVARAKSYSQKTYDSYIAGEFGPKSTARYESDVRKGVITLPKGGALKEDPAEVQKTYDDYLSGQFGPKSKARYEADVMEGRIGLPKGASIIDSSGRFLGKSSDQVTAAQGQPAVASLDKTLAYHKGTMPQAERAQFESDISAGKIKPAEITPGGGVNANVIAQKRADAGNKQSLLGDVVDAGKYIISSIPAGLNSMSFTDQAAANQSDFRKNNTKSLQNLIIPPTTSRGEAIAKKVGDTLFQLTPMSPIGPGLGMGAVPAGGLRAATRMAVNEGKAMGIPQAVDALKSFKPVEAVKAIKPDMVKGSLDVPLPTVLPVANVSDVVKAPAKIYRKATGSAEVIPKITVAQAELAKKNQARANTLPEPVKLTHGQATGDVVQLKFEKDVGANAKKGVVLRDFSEQQQQALIKSLPESAVGLKEFKDPVLSTGELTGDTVKNSLVDELKRYGNFDNTTMDSPVVKTLMTESGDWLLKRATPEQILDLKSKVLLNQLDKDLLKKSMKKSIGKKLTTPPELAGEFDWGPVKWFSEVEIDGVINKVADTHHATPIGETLLSIKRHITALDKLKTLESRDPFRVTPSLEAAGLKVKGLEAQSKSLINQIKSLEQTTPPAIRDNLERSLLKVKAELKASKEALSGTHKRMRPAGWNDAVKEADASFAELKKAPLTPKIRDSLNKIEVLKGFKRKIEAQVAREMEIEGLTVPNIASLGNRNLRTISAKLDKAVIEHKNLVKSFVNNKLPNLRNTDPGVMVGELHSFMTPDRIRVWSNVQRKVLDDIKTSAIRSERGVTSFNQEAFSKSLQEFGGKKRLEAILGKPTTELLYALEDTAKLAKEIKVGSGRAPAGVAGIIDFLKSNGGSVLFDIITASVTGNVMPIATVMKWLKSVRDNRALHARVKSAIKGVENAKIKPQRN